MFFEEEPDVGPVHRLLAAYPLRAALLPVSCCWRPSQEVLELAALRL